MGEARNATPESERHAAGWGPAALQQDKPVKASVSSGRSAEAGGVNATGVRDSDGRREKRHASANDSGLSSLSSCSSSAPRLHAWRLERAAFAESLHVFWIRGQVRRAAETAGELGNQRGK